MAAKLYPVLAIAMILRIFGAILFTCSAATLYTVGDTSGWDISTNLDTWANDKTFLVGDVLCKKLKKKKKEKRICFLFFIMI